MCYWTMNTIIPPQKKGEGGKGEGGKGHSHDKGGIVFNWNDTSIRFDNVQQSSLKMGKGRGRGKGDLIQFKT